MKHVQALKVLHITTTNKAININDILKRWENIR
jgi:hypothetical protein